MNVDDKPTTLDNILVEVDDKLTWAEIEELFPDASPQWDAQGGDAWLGDNEPTFVMAGANLAIGYGEPPKARWALWNNESKKWLFIPRPVKLEQVGNAWRMSSGGDGGKR